MYLSHSFSKCKMRIVTTFLSRLWDYQNKLLPSTVPFEGTQNKWLLLLLITMTFSEHNFYIFFGNQHLSIPLVLCQTKYDEWILENEIIRLHSKIWDLFSGVARSLEICKTQKDNSGVWWHIIQHSIKFFTGSRMYTGISLKLEFEIQFLR